MLYMLTDKAATKIYINEVLRALRERENSQHLLSSLAQSQKDYTHTSDNNMHDDMLTRMNVHNIHQV